MSTSSIPQEMHAIPPAEEGDLLTPIPTDAGCTASETFGPEVTVTGGTTPAAHRTLVLPGPKTIISASFRSVREVLFSQLLVNQAHMAVGKEKKIKWGDFYEQTLGIGATAPCQGALMGAFAPYSNAKPWIKFEKFVLAGVAFDDSEYCQKMSSGATRSIEENEKFAHTITSQMEEFYRVTGEEKLAAATRAAELRSSNETSEYILGLRNSDPGGRPYLPVDLTEDDPVSVLGPRPSARSGNDQVRKNSRKLFESSQASKAAAERDKAGDLEREQAASAASGAAVPRKFAPGEAKKNKRNADAQERMDNLLGGMMDEANLMADAIKSITSGNKESPTKKRQRQINEITANLAMLYQEKKMLMDMGLPTGDVDEQIKKLSQERSSL